ncbi:MAG: hypothetical protein SOY30_15975 [Eubacteriales bacterium]|nr:hypothetical protein [Eubacteriales bacterium]
MNSDCESIAVPQLVINLRGYGWRCRMNVNVLMFERPIGDLKDFIHLYLRCMPMSEENLEAVRRMAEWFPKAIACKREMWHKASLAYVNGYRAPVRKTDAWSNNRLEKAIRRAKRSVEKLEKRQLVFQEECQKHKIPIPDQKN